MTRPASPEHGGADTPEVSGTAQQPAAVRPWDFLERSPRPSQWTDPASSRAIHSYSLDLFAALAELGVLSSGWNQVQALTSLQHMGRNALQASYDRDFSRTTCTHLTGSAGMSACW